MSRRALWFVLLYVTLAVATGFADLRMRAHAELAVTKFIPDVVTGTEFAPGKYRVLVPFFNTYLSRFTGLTPMLVWHVTRLLWFFAAYCVMHVYLRTWFTAERALTGVALVAATLPLTFTNSWPHPDHAAELALFPLAALAIARHKDAWFAIVLPVAALNRETSVFLVLLYAVTRPLSRTHLMRTALFACEWLTVYGGLRIVRGYSSYDMWQAGRNLADLAIPLPATYDPYYRAYAYFVVALFGPMLALGLTAREPPLFVRRALLVVPAIVVVAFLLSNIIETRIFTPIYACLLPATLFALMESDHER